MKRHRPIGLPLIVALLLAACAAPAPNPPAPAQAAAALDDDLLCRPWPATCD